METKKPLVIKPLSLDGISRLIDTFNNQPGNVRLTILEIKKLVSTTKAYVVTVDHAPFGLITLTTDPFPQIKAWFTDTQSEEIRKNAINDAILQFASGSKK